MTKPIETITAEELYYSLIPQIESEMIVEGMIPQGLTILAGPPKSCKSWLALDLALAVAEGRSILGKQTKKCSVLYLALEDRRARLQMRLHSMNVKEAPTNFHFATDCPPLGDGFLKSLADRLDQDKSIRLVIIDTLQMIRKGYGGISATNQYGKDTEDLTALKKFADKRNLAILIVHHVTKRIDPYDPVNDIRGSSGMTATPDSILILRKQRVQKDGELLSVSRDMPQWKMRMRFEGCRWQLQDLITEEEMEKEEIPEILFRITGFVRERGIWEGTMTQLLEVLGEKEMTSNVLSRKIAQFGYSVFHPEHIEVRQRRSSSERRYTFRYCMEEHQPEHDDAPKHEESSLSSSSSLPDREMREAVERARRTLLGT